MTDLSEPLFLFGAGYSGRALARLYPGRVMASFRSDSSRVKLSGTSIEAIDINQQDALRRSVSGAHVLVSAPPGEAGCPAYQALSGFADETASITYLSTTGVYGDLGGGWAMEWSVPNPQSERAKRRVVAESSWQGVSAPVRIVRLPGIYGPGRSAFDRIRKGTARRIIRDGQVFSRIHVDDIAAGLLALLRSDRAGVFHLCDEEAAPPQDVIKFAAELLGVPAPSEIAFEDADLSAMGRSFYSECKRVSNAKVKAATGWRPLYGSYRDGLSAILSGET